MPILASSFISAPGNASPAMNSDMVKPMPPSRLTPRMARQRDRRRQRREPRRHGQPGEQGDADRLADHQPQDDAQRHGIGERLAQVAAQVHPRVGQREQGDDAERHPARAGRARCAAAAPARPRRRSPCSWMAACCAAVGQHVDPPLRTAASKSSRMRARRATGTPACRCACAPGWSWPAARRPPWRAPRTSGTPAHSDHPQEQVDDRAARTPSRLATHQHAARSAAPPRQRASTRWRPCRRRRSPARRRGRPRSPARSGTP